MNQTAQHLASQGRYGDTTLVHMSPQEVRGLQALARNNGTSLTVNPNTGLPEAFNLGRLLPMVAGAGLAAFTGMNPLTIGLLTGGLGAVATGSLKEGLMMGLGAAGGAGLAGSMANLAAPAATTAATTAAPTVATTSAVPAALPEVAATQSAAATNAAGAAKSGLGGFGPMRPIAQGPMSLDPLVYGTPNFSTASMPNATYFTTETLPVASSISLPPQASMTSRLASGFKAATASPEAFGSYLGDNKMNLAMSSAPALLAEPNYEGGPESNAMIRPYSLEIDNTSGIAASPVGREDERLRYRYTAGTPYRAAKGGIMSLAEGGSTSQGNTTDGQEINTNPSPVSPEAMRVYQSIARIQNAAGLPQLDMTGMEPSQPSPVQRIAAQSPQSMYQVRDYGVRMPSYNDSETYRDMEKARKEGGLGGLFGRLFDGSDGYAEGGQAKYRDVRKKINRMDDPYSFAAYQSGRGLYDAAMQNFAGGGLSNVPRFLSGGGDGMSDSIPATINDRQPARLADGEFVIPADVVSHLGNGSSKAGAKQLYDMMDRVRSKRTGKKKQAPAVNPKKMMPA